jgi:hypothetical protein
MLGYSIALIVGIVLVGLLIGVLGRRGRPAGRVPHDGPVERSQPAADGLRAMAHSQQLLDACRSCVAACEEVMRELQEAAHGNDAVRHCIEVCRAARRICLSIEELPYASGFALRMCRLGAVLCRACADECALHHSAAARACGDACRRCVEVFHHLAVATVRRNDAPRPAPFSRAAQRARVYMRGNA